MISSHFINEVRYTQLVEAYLLSSIDYYQANLGFQHCDVLAKECYACHAHAERGAYFICQYKVAWGKALLVRK